MRTIPRVVWQPAMLTKVSVLVVLGLVVVLAAALLRGRDGGRSAFPGSEPLFVFVRLPESIKPLERGARYEDPLAAALESSGSGEVTGGGSQLGEVRPDGTRLIEWVGIDVELTDASRGLAVVRSELKRLGAPRGTILEYTRGAVKVEEPLW